MVVRCQQSLKADAEKTDRTHKVEESLAIHTEIYFCFYRNFRQL